MQSCFFTKNNFFMFFRLFVRSLYTGPLIVQSLLFNRRRNDLELRRTQAGTYIFSNSGESADGISSTSEDSPAVQNPANDTDEVEKEKVLDEPVPMIYACATMWHEEEDEMKALFKSIFR